MFDFIKEHYILSFAALVIIIDLFTTDKDDEIVEEIELLKDRIKAIDIQIEKETDDDIISDLEDEQWDIEDEIEKLELNLKIERLEKDNDDLEDERDMWFMFYVGK